MKLSRHDPILVFIGPSGAGKSSVVNKLVEDGIIELTPTWTDRPVRSGEKDQEHTFVSSAKFDKLVAQKFFAHTPVQLFGLPYRYASPFIAKPKGKKVPAIMARVTVLDLTKKLYPKCTIYQIEAPKDIVAKRLKGRGETQITLGTRLTNFEDEVITGHKLAKRVFNNIGTLESITVEIKQCIKHDFNKLPETKL